VVLVVLLLVVVLVVVVVVLLLLLLLLQEMSAESQKWLARAAADKEPIGCAGVSQPALLSPQVSRLASCLSGCLAVCLPGSLDR
jgi:hypothetical protein